VKSRTEILRLGLLVLVVGLISATAGRLLAYPEPALAPVSWELDFEYQDPQLIRVRLPGEDQPRLFAYMTYTVTNDTGEEQLFFPEVTVYTDQGDLFMANRQIPVAVFDRIKARERNRLLESPYQAVGKLLQGEDHARDSVIVWPIHDKDVNLVKLFVSGLSGETQSTPHPRTGEQLLLRKTLMLGFRTPGDLSHNPEKPFVLEDSQWIMR